MKILKYRSRGLRNRINIYTFSLMVELNGEETQLDFIYKIDDDGEDFEITDSEGKTYSIYDELKDIEDEIYEFIQNYVEMDYRDEDWVLKDDLNIL